MQLQAYDLELQLVVVSSDLPLLGFGRTSADRRKQIPHRDETANACSRLYRWICPEMKGVLYVPPLCSATDR